MGRLPGDLRRSIDKNIWYTMRVLVFACVKRGKITLWHFSLSPWTSLYVPCNSLIVLAHCAGDWVENLNVTTKSGGGGGWGGGLGDGVWRGTLHPCCVSRSKLYAVFRFDVFLGHPNHRWKPSDSIFGRSFQKFSPRLPEKDPGWL